MKNKKIYFSVLPLLVVLVFVPYLLFSDKFEEKGVVTYVDGRVKKKKPKLENWITAHKNTEVVRGEKVRTYQRSRAEIKLAGMDIVRLAPETTIDIVKLYEESKDTQVRTTKIKIEAGDLWATVSKKTKKIKFKLDTPIAGTAVTGTKLEVRFALDSTSEVRVYKGEVKVSNAKEDIDRLKISLKLIKPYQIQGPHQVPGPHKVTMERWLYIVKEMQMLKIDKHGQVKFAGSFSIKDMKNKADWVNWNLKRDKTLGLK